MGHALYGNTVKKWCLLGARRSRYRYIYKNEEEERRFRNFRGDKHKKDDCYNKTTKNDQNPVGQDSTQKGILHKIVHINKIRLRTVKYILSFCI